MAKPKPTITTHFERMIVRPKPPPPYSAGGIYRTDDLDPEAGYKVLATYVHCYKDGSREPCFMIAGPDGTILERASTLFVAVEIDGKPVGP